MRTVREPRRSVSERLDEVSPGIVDRILTAYDATPHGDASARVADVFGVTPDVVIAVVRESVERDIGIGLRRRRQPALSPEDLGW